MTHEPPTAITLPFFVCVDSREQAGWHFNGVTRRVSSSGPNLPLIVPLLTNVTLKSGDYSIRGLESRITIERKSRGDWFSSISAERERFEREMQRLSEFDYAAVVVEADWRGLDEHQTRVPISACVGTVAAWSIRYGVHFWFLPSRREAEVFTLRLLEKFWEHAERKRKDAEQREFIEGLAATVSGEFVQC